MLVHALNSSTQRQRQVELSEFKASLVYKMSFRIIRAKQRDSVSKTKIGETLN